MAPNYIKIPGAIIKINQNLDLDNVSKTKTQIGFSLMIRKIILFWASKIVLPTKNKCKSCFMCLFQCTFWHNPSSFVLMLPDLRDSLCALCSSGQNCPNCPQWQHRQLCWCENLWNLKAIVQVPRDLLNFSQNSKYYIIVKIHLFGMVICLEMQDRAVNGRK